MQSAHSRPVRILFHIHDFGKGGTETALIAWLNALDRTCFAPALSVSYPTDDLAFWRAHSLPADVPVHVLAEPKWMHGLHQAARQRKLRGGKKVLHKVLTYGAIRPFTAARFRRIAAQYDLVCDFDFSLRHLAGSGGVPWIGVSHFSLRARLGGKDARYVARRVRQYGRYSAVAVLTADMLREAVQLMGGTGIDITELPNVIDIEAIRRKAAEPAELPRRPYIVSVARLDEGQKDHKTLLRGYAKMRAAVADAPDLLLIGEGRDRHVLEALARERGIDHCVHFHGFCANPFPYIRRAEMLVLSSRYEGFGMVLAEAMALQTPVISADCPTGPRDLLDGGRAGLLVPPGDVDAMADALARLLNDTALRRTLVAHARERVATLSPESANRRMRDLAARLLRARPANRSPRPRS